MASILFIHQNFPAQFCHLAPALATLGHKVAALGTADHPPYFNGVRYRRYILQQNAGNGLDEHLDSLGTKISRARCSSASLQEMRKEGWDPDVIVVHPGWGEGMFIRDVFPRSKILMYAEYYYGSEGGDLNFDPEFSAPPTLESRQRARLKNTHLLHAMSTADAGLSPTRFQATRHPLWFQERITKIHEGIDTNIFKPNPAARLLLARDAVELRRGDEIVTFVARQLEPYRGFHVFMRAVPLLQRLRPKCRIIIVGSDGVSYGAPPPNGKTWKDIFRDEVSSEVDMGRIHFVGRLPHKMLTELMQVTTVYTYLSYPFVLSWSLMEAMSCGCLVVGSRTAPVEEVIEHGYNGILTDFFDHSALAEQIADALKYRTQLSKLKVAARDTIISRYDLHSKCLPAQIDFVLSFA